MDIRLTQSQGSQRRLSTTESPYAHARTTTATVSPIREAQFFSDADSETHKRELKQPVNAMSSTVSGGGALYLPAVFDVLCNDPEAQRFIYDFSVVQSTLDDVFQAVVEKATE